MNGSKYPGLESKTQPTKEEVKEVVHSVTMPKFEYLQTGIESSHLLIASEEKGHCVKVLIPLSI